MTAGRAIAGTAQDSPARTAGIRSRWLVHLALILTLAVSLVPLLLFGVSARVTIHVVIACVFAGLAAIHLLQRRRTLARLATGLARAGARLRPVRRLARSGACFTFLLVNVIASGVLDAVAGGNYLIPLPGLPRGISWHGLSSVVFVGYLVVHVIRRRRRLRNSVIR